MSFDIHNIKISFLPDLSEVYFGIVLMFLVLGMQKKEVVAMIVSRYRLIKLEIWSFCTCKWRNQL